MSEVTTFLVLVGIAVAHEDGVRLFDEHGVDGVKRQYARTAPLGDGLRDLLEDCSVHPKVREGVKLVQEGYVEGLADGSIRAFEAEEPWLAEEQVLKG